MNTDDYQGSITEIERKKGTVYRVRIGRKYTEDGRPGFDRTYDSREEAERILMKKNYELGEGIELETEEISFGDWLDNWLEKFVPQGCTDSTYDKYSSLAEVHVKPALGHIKMGSLSTSHIQDLYQRMQSADYDQGTGGAKSTSTVDAVHRMLHKAVDDAINHVPPLLEKNPVSAAIPPKKESPDVSYLRPNEISSFMELAQEESYSPLYTLGLMTGMRPGELRGLHWEDIDWENNQLTVRHAVVRSGAQEHISSPKTNETRTIGIPEFLIEMLRDHRRFQKMMRKNSEEAWAKPELVCSTSVGTIISHGSLGKQFRRIVQEGEFDDNLSPNSLRHTHATDLLRKVGPGGLKMVSRRLGHSSVKTTLDRYGHVLEAQKEEVVDLLDERFSEVA